MKHYGDITKIRGDAVPIVDVITGGSPCQDLSVAGARTGLDGERSSLFFEQVRVIKEMREYDVRTNHHEGILIRPRFMVFENVPGLLTSNGGEDFRRVLEEVARVVDPRADVPRPNGGDWSAAGFIMGNGYSISWRVHNAELWGKTIRDGDTGDLLKMGTPQRRRRLALVADFGSTTAPTILFERESVRGHIEESEQKGENAPG